MTVKRIENLDIKHRNVFTAIVGNTDDVFIDNDLCRYKFEHQLCLYLKSQGYDYVYFYSRAREFGLYTYDGPEALQWLFQDDTQQAPQSQDVVNDGRPLGRSGRYRNRRNTDISNNGPIKHNVESKPTYWYVIFNDTTFTGQIKKILEDKKRKSVICFISTAFEPSEPEGLIGVLNSFLFDAGVSESVNKMLFVYEAKDYDELYSKHFKHPNTKFFNRDFFTNQFTKDNKLNFDNIFLVKVPEETECKNWINYQRIIKNSLNNEMVFSFPFDKLAKQICKQKKTLLKLEKEDIKSPEFIENLRVVEFSESYLENALSEIHGQEDNISVITDQVVTFVNELEFNVEKPLVLMFAGTSGTGKTYTAETIANALESRGFGYLLLAMNEYSDEMSSAKLMGSAPGYVGSGQDSPIFAERKKHDRLVIVFDEIEKAHENILLNLMNLMDKGFLSNGLGEQIDFRESIIIFTTNLCMNQLIQKKAELKKAKVGVESYKFQKDTKQILKNGGMRNEVAGRIGCLLIYNPLTVEAVLRIGIEEIRKLGARYNIRVNNIPEGLLQQIIQIANSNEGARPIQDIVELTLRKIFQKASRKLNNN